MKEGQLRKVNGTGKVLLVYKIDGIYAGVMHQGGETEGYYAKWLQENSEVLSESR
jgi:hypothetical protein